MTSNGCGLQTNSWSLTVAGQCWSQCNINQPLQLFPGKLTMRFQSSLPSIYSLYLRRICCIYRGGGKMIKSNRLFPSLRLLWSLSTHKIQTWVRSPKYLVSHFFFFQMDIRGCSESYKDLNWFRILLSMSLGDAMINKEETLWILVFAVG